MTSVIDDPILETAGYIGYLPSDNSIYTIFRGSSNIPNWITDLDTAKTPYTYWPECGCEVHQGFYTASQAAWP